MDVVTIACPPGFTDENVAETAPIWIDANGVEYRVASGLLDGYEPAEPSPATPDRVNIVTGLDGLAALAMMGLTLVDAGS